MTGFRCLLEKSELDDAKSPENSRFHFITTLFNLRGGAHEYAWFWYKNDYRVLRMLSQTLLGVSTHTLPKIKPRELEFGNSSGPKAFKERVVGLYEGTKESSWEKWN